MNMTLSTQPYKGARDFYPEDKRLQKYIFGIWREVAERYGYEEYDAPLIEALDIYRAKTGEEIVKEQVYSFVDRGDREVAIRPEMTPSVSRMVAAKRQELAYPLRWYSIPNLWRYERPQRGRLREHWQLNVDIFGLEGLEAELEIIQIADSIMQAFGAKRESYTIRLNSRQVLDWLLKTHWKLDDKKAHSVTKLLDKKAKIPADEFKKLLKEELGDDLATEALVTLDANHLKHLPKGAPSERLEQLMDRLHANGIANAVFDVTLARGFDYYTDIVFEVFDNYPENNRALFGGGRYDGLVGLFGVDPVPTVGFGMGDVALSNFLDSHTLRPKLQSETDIYTVLIGDVYHEMQKVINELRGMGLNVAVDMSGRKVDNQIKAAVKKGVAFALFIGEKNLKAGRYSLKNLTTQQEAQLNTEEILTAVVNARGA